MHGKAVGVEKKKKIFNQQLLIFYVLPHIHTHTHMIPNDTILFNIIDCLITRFIVLSSRQ